MICIVNYGLGNIHAIVNIYHRLNIDVRIASTTDDLSCADRIILPGVGAFDWAMTRLNQSGMRRKLDEMVLFDGIPVLGICIGMQMMADRSDEGILHGLGWIDGEVKKFKSGPKDKNMRLPHMGWNNVRPLQDGGLFNGLDADSRFYFLHSYFFQPHERTNVYAQTDYYGIFASCVHERNIYGVQFHPEKSHRWGIKLLKNFSEI